MSGELTRFRGGNAEQGDKLNNKIEVTLIEGVVNVDGINYT